jgi:hypothetical protein
MHVPDIEQKHARQYPLKQEAEAGPALCECGKKALQENSPV